PGGPGGDAERTRSVAGQDGLKAPTLPDGASEPGEIVGSEAGRRSGALVPRSSARSKRLIPASRPSGGGRSLIAVARAPSGRTSRRGRARRLQSDRGVHRGPVGAAARSPAARLTETSSAEQTKSNSPDLVLGLPACA